MLRRRTVFLFLAGATLRLPAASESGCEPASALSSAATRLRCAAVDAALFLFLALVFLFFPLAGLRLRVLRFRPLLGFLLRLGALVDLRLLLLVVVVDLFLLRLGLLRLGAALLGRLRLRALRTVLPLRRLTLLTPLRPALVAETAATLPPRFFRLRPRLRLRPVATLDVDGRQTRPCSQLNGLPLNRGIYPAMEKTFQF